MSQLNQNSIALEELKTMAASLPAAITIDSTLTQEGQAADAKAVGDALTTKVPTTRTVNGKALSTNITLAASDVGAAPAYTYGRTDMTAGTSALETGTLYFVYE